MDMDEDIEMDEESLQAGTYVLSLQLLSVLLSQKMHAGEGSRPARNHPFQSWHGFVL